MSESSTAMKPAFLAGAAYFVLVFALGFVLGTVRVLVLVPQFGELYSSLTELPIILTAAWFMCRWLVNRFALDDHWPARAMMGITAFILLMMAELVLSTLLFDRSLLEHIVYYLNLHAMLGLAGQVAYAVFPLLVGRARS